jgi:hypothetical protein
MVVKQEVLDVSGGQKPVSIYQLQDADIPVAQQPMQFMQPAYARPSATAFGPRRTNSLRR